MALTSVESRRIKYRRGLHRLYLPYYDALCEELHEDYQPTSGLRSLNQQGSFYAQGRTMPGKIVTNSEPGLSFHNYGLATDWDFFPNGVYTPLSYLDARWIAYYDACAKVSLRCISYERPHNEAPMKVSTRSLRLELETNGVGGLDALIEKGLS